ncbi:MULTISPECIES: hypothetical protein [unclassified Actinotignum]|uniref:hypothetical protein n=1 Tax=unclassified Actinotignum TaxID=2632702 RepID=UPI003F48251E
MNVVRSTVLAGAMTLISMVGLRSVGLPWYAWVIQFVILVGAGLAWGKFLDGQPGDSGESGHSQGSKAYGGSPDSSGVAGRRQRRTIALLIAAVAAVILILVYLCLVTWV